MNWLKRSSDLGAYEEEPNDDKVNIEIGSIEVKENSKLSIKPKSIPINKSKTDIGKV